MAVKPRFADAVTGLNLVAGVLALYEALLGHLLFASLLVVAAAAFDFLDGRVARLLKQSSAFGKELDSLADLVSFGVAPGVILLTAHGNDPWVLAAAVLFAVAGAYRLARFNVTKAKGYEGLPIPVAGLLALAGLPLAAWAHALLLILLAALMASTIKVPKP